MKKVMKILGNVIFYGLLAIFIVVILTTFNAKKTGSVPSIGGYKILNVLTGSMNPTFDAGSMIIIKETPENEIKEGDIITYNFDGSTNIVTHRVVEIIQGSDGNEYITRGDANNANDPNAIKYKNVEGVVIKSMPKVGEVVQYIGENIVVIIIVILAVCGVILLMQKVFKGK